MSPKRDCLKLFLLMTFVLWTDLASARGTSGGREEDYVVSNGQGISSPSFWDGLSGENPAGLTRNTSLKLQGGAASSGGALKPIGAALIGNGLLGAGLEYSTLGGGSSGSQGTINWGIAGYLSGLSTSIGVSGHHQTGSSGGSYDLGAIIDLSSSLHLGVLLPSFTNGISVIGGGLTWNADRSIDLVLDGSINVGSGGPDLALKPGISLHMDRIQVTAAYGFGSSPSLVSRDLTAGLGVRLSQSALLGYEFQGSAKHRLGLTLKLD